MTDSQASFIKPIARVFGAVALALGLAAAPHAPAAAQSSDNQSQAAQPSFEETEIKSFAEASVAIETISEKWSPRIAEAESEAKTNELREKAMAEMVDAVKDEGLDVETYNRIYAAAQQDSDLAEKITEYRDQVN